MPKREAYVLSDCVSTRCAECGALTVLLAPARVVSRLPAFYVCWTCKTVAQAGVGPVKEDNT